MMKNNPFLFILLLFLALLVGLLVGFKVFFQENESSLTINGQRIKLEVADQTDEIKQGLSGRNSLAEDTGMIFLFTQKDRYSFWMKDMKFNLDFVFISDKKVIEIMENVPYPQPGELPKAIVSQEEFDKVIELNQGMVEKLDIKVGDEIKLSL